MAGLLTRRTDDLRSVLALRAFRLFSIGNFSSLVSIWIIRVCVGWLTWELTHSKSWLGAMAFAELGPSVIVSLAAGPLADTDYRWKVLRFGQSIQAMLALVLILLVVFKALTVWWMFWIMIGFSVLGGLNLPARMSVAPSLVPRSQLATAAAVGSISFNVSRLIGPLIAAPLLAIDLDIAGFALAALGFAINAYSIAQVKPQDLIGTPGDRPARPALGGYGEVVRDILQDRALSIVLALQLTVSLLIRPLTDMFPAFADSVFRAGEGGYGALNAAVGIGAILGALLMVGEMAGRTMRHHILIGSMIYGATGIAFAMAGSLWLALAVLALHGAALTSSSVSSTTFVQVRIPTERLGRVMSIYSVIFRLAPALGALALGGLADAVGLGWSTAALVALAMLVVAILWRPLITETGAGEP